MADVGIECWRQRRTISHDTNPCMTMTMNATLMRLRTAKPPLQVQVIARIGGHLGAHEQARAKRCHPRAGHRNGRLGPDARTSCPIPSTIPGFAPSQLWRVELRQAGFGRLFASFTFEDSGRLRWQNEDRSQVRRQAVGRNIIRLHKVPLTESHRFSPGQTPIHRRETGKWPGIKSGPVCQRPLAKAGEGRSTVL